MAKPLLSELLHLLLFSSSCENHIFRHGPLSFSLSLANGHVQFGSSFSGSCDFHGVAGKSGRRIMIYAQLVAETLGGTQRISPPPQRWPRHFKALGIRDSVLYRCPLLFLSLSLYLSFSSVPGRIHYTDHLVGDISHFCSV